MRPVTVEAPESQAVRQSYQRQIDAMVAGDTHALTALLAETYTAEHIGGAKQSREQWLADIAAGRFRYHAVREVGTDVEFKNDRAQLRSNADIEVTIGGHRSTWPVHTVIDYQLVGGRWLAVHSRTTLR
jgi:Domain of unknown function (DUF4440)